MSCKLIGKHFCVFFVGFLFVFKKQCMQKTLSFLAAFFAVTFVLFLQCFLHTLHLENEEKTAKKIQNKTETFSYQFEAHQYQNLRKSEQKEKKNSPKFDIGWISMSLALQLTLPCYKLVDNIMYLHCTSRTALALTVIPKPFSTEHQYFPESFLLVFKLSVSP